MDALKETRTTFAARAGVGTTTVAAIHQGKSISKDSAQHISAAQGKPLAALFEPVNADEGLSAKTSDTTTG